MARNRSFAPRASWSARGFRGGARGRGSRSHGLTPLSAAELSLHSTRGAGRPHEAVLTLAEEARQTSQLDHSFWGENSKLRNKPVSFLSAGKSEPLKHVTEAPSACLREGRDEQQYDGTAGLGEKDMGGAPEPDMATQEAMPDPENEETAPFFVDLAGQKAADEWPTAPVSVPERHTSPDTSSSEEVILFRGRKNGFRATCPVDPVAIQVHVEAQAMQPQNPKGPKAPGIPSTARLRSRGRGRRCRRGRRRGNGNTSDDSILDDYIANMRENGDLDEMLRRPHRPDEPECDSQGEEAADDALVQSANGTDDQGDKTESEIDDETLARLIAGQNLASRSGMDRQEQWSSDSDSTLDAGRGRRDNNADAMDWERQTAHKKKGKGWRGQMNPDDGYDTELEQQMQAAWQNDRLKKKQRKQQREEMRALGLLGPQAKPEDLRVKYPVGMSIQEVAEELRSYLRGVDEILTFPPMDLHARKVIHELAGRFKANSKSTGKAEQRRTTVYRTGRTLPYVESTFEQAMARVRRRYLPRPDVKGKRGTNGAAPVRGSHKAASYRDGEVVGAAAPELGTENRGRAMLEKMGWSSGTALGAAHNKGILQPVTQTMKTSKAGLG